MALETTISLNLASKEANLTITSEENNTTLNTWNLDITPANTTKIIDYKANGDDTTVDLLIRALSNTISYSDFVYILILLDHYQGSVKKFLKL